MAIYFDLQDDGTIVDLLNTDLSIIEDADAVLKSLENILTTERGSRIYFQRDFGVSLDQFLFEPIDNETAIRIFDEITLGINNEERISDSIVEIIPLEDQNTFEINIEFKIFSSNRFYEFTTTLREIR